jgi:hypothetical protein
MQSQLDVEQIITKTRQYEFADGLRDMQLAVLWVGMGALLWFQFEMADVWFTALRRFVAWAGRWGGMSAMLVTMLPALLALLALLLINVVRKRWLWRKSGMVKSNRIVLPRRATIISVVIVLVGLGITYALMKAGLVDDQFALKGLFSVSGVSFGYTMVELGKHVDLARYTRIGWIGGVLSLLVLIVPLSVGQTGLVLGILWGVVLVANGASPLVNSIRAARGAEDERSDQGH